MLTFEEFCDYATCSGRYTYFVLDSKFVNSLTDTEKLLVHIQPKEDNFVHVWYPKSNWKQTTAISSLDDLAKDLVRAVVSGNFTAVEDIQKKIASCH